MSDAIRAGLSIALSWAIAFLFLCAAIYQVKRNSPAQFYPWFKVKADMLTDVRSYNQEMCSLWGSCSFVLFLVGVIGFFSNRILALLFAFCIFPGILFVSKRYKKILHAYLIEAVEQRKKEEEKDVREV